MVISQGDTILMGQTSETFLSQHSPLPYISRVFCCLLLCATWLKPIKDDKETEKNIQYNITNLQYLEHHERYNLLTRNRGGLPWNLTQNLVHISSETNSPVVKPPTKAV